MGGCTAAVLHRPGIDRLLACCETPPKQRYRTLHAPYMITLTGLPARNPSIAATMPAKNSR